jgi:hypothetical protein
MAHRETHAYGILDRQAAVLGIILGDDFLKKRFVRVNPLLERLKLQLLAFALRLGVRADRARSLAEPTLRFRAVAFCLFLLALRASADGPGLGSRCFRHWYSGDGNFVGV